MKFDEHQEYRLKAGKREHKNGWKDWNKKTFIINAQEELVDCANYLETMADRVRSAELSKVVLQVTGDLERLYDELELWRNLAE